VHPRAADAFFSFERDCTAAPAMRDRLFPRAVSEGALIAATHMPFPGLGRVVNDRGQMRWQVADWAFQGRYRLCRAAGPRRYNRRKRSS